VALSAGDIVFLYVPSLKNPKEKFAVVACVQPRPILLLISTELTEFKQIRLALRAEQIVVKADDHPCLKYDSWLDCTEPHCYDELCTECDERPEIIVGHISPALRAEIVTVVTASKTLTRRNKASILAAINPVVETQ
jgi:hypothetical protein